jgi:hypothetical protein
MGGGFPMLILIQPVATSGYTWLHMLAAHEGGDGWNQLRI